MGIGRGLLAVGIVIALSALTLAPPAMAAPGGDATLATASLTVPEKNQQSGVAMCPSGTRATGGGVNPLNPVATGTDYNRYRVSFSAPVDETGTVAGTDSGDIPRGWTATVASLGGETSFRIYAVCSATSDATVVAFTSSVGGTTTLPGMASCPSGSRAIGGGVGTSVAIPASTNPTFPFANVNVPVDAGGTVTGTQTGDIPQSWRAAVSFQSTAPSPVGGTVKFFAVCSVSSDATIQATPFTVTVAGKTDPVNGAVASCPSGQRALSGGVAFDGDPVGTSIRIQRNGPLDSESTADAPAGTDAGDVARSWYGAERSAVVDADFRTIAVCATDDVPTPPDTAACDDARATLATAQADRAATDDLVAKLKRKVAKAKKRAKKAKSKSAKKKLKKAKAKLRAAQRDLDAATDAEDAAAARVAQLC